MIAPARPGKIEGDSNLVKLLNAVIKELNFHFATLTPLLNTYSIYYDEWFENREKMAANYYELVLALNYFHEMVEKLAKWRTKAVEYNTEYNGSWSYYARCKRIDSIKEFGGDEDDYNDDGTIKTKVPMKMLQYYTLIYELSGDNRLSIFQTTAAHHLNLVYVLLLNKSHFSLEKILGTDLPMQSQMPDGTYQEISWADKRLNEAKEQHVSDNLADFLHSAVKETFDLVLDVRVRHWNRNYTEFFKALPARIDAIFDLAIPMHKLPREEASND